MKKPNLALCVFLLSFVLFANARGEAVPTVEEECLNDYAEVVGKNDRDRIKTLCRKASEQKVPMMVITVKSLDEFRPRPLNVDRFADRIFNDWDTGYTEGGDAVMLFISVKENEFRLLLGERFSERLRSKAMRIINNTLIPAFRKRAHSSGIRQVYNGLFYDVVKPHLVAMRKETEKKVQEAIRKEMESDE